MSDTRMSTRGNKAAIPDELKKHTSEEQCLAREMKKSAAEARKAEKKAAKDDKKSKGAKRVAALEDKQMLEDKHIQSLRPDFDMPMNLPDTSRQSIGSILTLSKRMASVPPSPPAALANTAASDDGSPSQAPSPIPSPQYDLAPALNDADIDTEVGTDGDGLPTILGMQTASKLEGTTEDLMASEVDESVVVLRREGSSIVDVLDSINIDVDHSVADTSSDSEYENSLESEGSASELEIDLESLKQIQEILRSQKAGGKPLKKKGSAKKVDEGVRDSDAEVESGSMTGKAGGVKGKISLDGKGKKKNSRTLAERKDARLEICHAIVAERNLAPKGAVKQKPDVTSTTASGRKRKDADTTGVDQRLASIFAASRKASLTWVRISRDLELKKWLKTELGGLAKDWQSVLIHANSITTSSVDHVEMLADVRVKTTKELVKKMPNIELKDADVQEIEVQERAKKSSWKNKDLPFEVFVCDLPVWQRKFIPSLIDWAMSDIKEPFGTTNHQDFKSTVQELWMKIFPCLDPKLEDGSARAEHLAIYGVAAAAVHTHQSDIGKEALRVMDRNWEHEDMKGYLTEEDRSKWVKEQLNGSQFLYKTPEEVENRGAFRGRLIMETFAFHLQAMMNAPYFHGNPISGLAVTASATNSKNNSNSFKDDPWGSVANKYFTHLAGYDNGKWREIILESTKYMNTRKSKSLAATEKGLGGASADGILNRDDNITLSP
ncbi:hypothetical protein IW261DRAFT_1413995 [Armillaria novae-zelandiae]|uniref:Uncharacterized protein n=1 Tax=Armillaria novae-zelandiae TaxID=153914 RepID=A0AA39TH38_9AGAR|nr:hypothetical protein IW261DRAFT_1413995 [Armillaria novae-zelandiae]